ncbi:MurR/RpiR family transcriptional regulator [Rhizobium sp. SL42]|uniref:MurR/RpiR family transcriptional regulator n=1 Tax=Rhizobium sp. SL42 TaxID=2806346 RepID=UPI001F41BACA|nr:MurR/RpiR family transcriptional regulator [Rhizobium sp. SL42]UJW73796.1 MurR/RpiR family transcriptional regulator [Rhizobium sp. SL42]
MHKKPNRLKDRLGEQLARRRHQLSPALLKVLEFIDTNRHQALGLSALEIGFAVGASDATVIRAIQSLGFSGMRELKDVLEAWLGETDSPIEKMASTLRDVNGEVDQALDFALQSIASTVEHLSSAENRLSLGGIAALFKEAKAITTFGIGASGIIAEYGARLFGRSGMPSHVLNATGIALAEQLLVLRPGHLLIMLLHGRSHREAMATISEAQKLDIPIVMILGKADTPLRAHAREVLLLPRTKSERIALHAPSLVALELLHVIYSMVEPETTIASLERLIDLRALIRPSGR